MKLTSLLFLASAPALAWANCPPLPDTDGDGVPDPLDNCTLVANADQRDTNNDGFGSICDPDFNNNGIVDPSDLSAIKAALGSTSAPDQDMNGNGIVDPGDLSRTKAYFGAPPGPAGSSDPVACATTEDLQAVGGVMPFPGGFITIPWQDMQPGETVSIYADPTILDLDATEKAAPSVRVVTPASVQSYDIELIAPAPAGTRPVIFVSDDEALSLSETPWPWYMMDSPGRVNLVLPPGAVDIRKTFYFVFGQICTYTNTVGEVRVDWLRNGLCTPEPERLPDVFGAVQATRNVLGASYVGFTLRPVQEVEIISGASAPPDGTSRYGVSVMNADWVAEQSLASLQSGLVHETCHSIMHDPLFADNDNYLVMFLGRRHGIESMTTHCEDKVGLSDYWTERYDFGADVTARGLEPNERRPDEKYNPFFPLHVDRTIIRFRFADFIEQQSTRIISGNLALAYAEYLETTLGGISSIYGLAAKNYHQRLLSIPYGPDDMLVPITTAQVSAGVSLPVGQSYVWYNDADDRACMRLSNTAGADVDTLLTYARAGENYDRVQVSAAVDGGYKLPGDYPAAHRIQPGNHVFTITSAQGTGYDEADPEITLQITRDRILWEECQ